MDIQKLEKRNPAMDIVRIVAVFSVVSIHFFLNNGFYSEIVSGVPMYIMSLMRTMFMVCVPLFIILTGYLMKNKTLSKKYYSGISKTLIIYVLSAIACLVFKSIYLNYNYTLKTFIFGILDFSGATYSWYVEMYIGLFLLIPFLNLAYNNLKSQRQKQVLVLTLFVLTILPTLFNNFNFDTAEWWANPASSFEHQKLIPSYWLYFYPIAYYYVGCYIREYGLKMSTRSLIVVFIAAVFAFGSYNFYRYHGGNFKNNALTYWYSFEAYFLTVPLFAILSRIKGENINLRVKWVLWKISDLALGIYLLSYIFDKIFYPKLCAAVPIMTDRLPYYFIMVPLVFICAALASAAINFLAYCIKIIYDSFVEFVKTQRKSENKINWQNVLFIFLMISALFFAFWKCSYGFGGYDESFYLTIPHRLTMGDSLFSDEWHLSQLSGFLLMPFVSLYTLITQSTDGIIFAARIVYVIFHAAVAVVAYIRLKKYGYPVVFGCVLYFLFTPFDIMAMSYNTMGMDFVVLTGALMGTADFKKPAPLIISGVTFAAAVLCCPYLAVAYLLYGICVIIHTAIKNRNMNNIFKCDIFAGKSFLFFSIGVFALAAVFFVFTLSRVSVSEILKNLPYMLSDPEHPQIPFTTRLNKYFTSISDCHPQFKIALYVYGAMLVAMLIDRKRKLHRSIYLCLTAAVVIFCYVLFIPQLTTKAYNSIMYPMIFMGVTSYILCDKKPKALFASLFMLGIIYSLAIHFTSNQYFYIISAVTATTNLASFVFLGRLLKEMKDYPDEVAYPAFAKKASFLLIAFMIAFLACMQINVKATHCFWDSNTSQLNVQITSGPAKGIYTTSAKKQTYKTICDDLTYYKDRTITKDNILFLTNKTWCYLVAEDYPYATFSAWISGEKQTSIDRLESYYSVNPDKIPEYIYIPKDSEWDFTNIYNDACQYGYSIFENNVSYKLEKIQ